jgi:DHA2 family multidrug resistance protein
LSAAINPFNPTLQALSPAAANGDPAALAQIDQLVNQQALMISYVADFKLMMLVTLCAIPLALFLRKPKAAAMGAPAAAHMD